MAGAGSFQWVAEDFQCQKGKTVQQPGHYGNSRLLTACFTRLSVQLSATPSEVLDSMWHGIPSAPKNSQVVTCIR